MRKRNSSPHWSGFEGEDKENGLFWRPLKRRSYDQPTEFSHLFSIIPSRSCGKPGRSGAARRMKGSRNGSRVAARHLPLLGQGFKSLHLNGRQSIQSQTQTPPSLISLTSSTARTVTGVMMVDLRESYAAGAAWTALWHLSFRTTSRSSSNSWHPADRRGRQAGSRRGGVLRMMERRFIDWKHPYAPSLITILRTLSGAAPRLVTTD